MAILVLVVGVMLHQLGLFPGLGTSGRHVAPGLEITPSLQDQDCIEDAAWSPDGQEIAVIGYRDLCPSDDPTSYNYQAGVLLMYSAATGKLLHTILPDATVLALRNLPAAPAGAQPAFGGADTSKLVLNYASMLWSPNGKQLALTFDVDHTTMVSNGEITSIVGRGLVLVNADGTNERAAFFTYSSQHYPAVRWDLSTLQPSTLPLPSEFSGPLSLSPAEQYSWSSSDQLLPSGSLTAATSSTAPIGNPDGGRTFTIWQPGYLSPDPHSGGPTSTTSFPAWSPDGRYLVDSVTLQSALQSPGAPSAAGPGPSGLPNQVIRDPALQRLVNSLRAGQSQDTQPFIEVAWSPSGRMLAAIPDVTGPDGGALPVTLYACASGTVLGTLNPKANPAVPDNSQVTDSFLTWSSDGSHLLVYSGPLATITIWNRDALP